MEPGWTGICTISVFILMTGTFDFRSEAKCDLQAIFNFGDSNSDTGGFYAVFPWQTGPFGMTYFGKPTGRASDGRLVIDFLAHALGIPFLSPYMQSIQPNFKHGANFATLASTVLLPNTSLFVSGISPFSLAIQLNQMKNFRSRVLKFQSQGRGRSRYLPSPDIFGKSLYILDIGQNDFTSKLAANGINGVKQDLPQVADQIIATVKDLYALGGRTFMVFNLAPIGCYPAFLVELPHRKSDLDAYGCLISYNEAVDGYNRMLHRKIKQARDSLLNASFIYVDTHSIKLELFRNPTHHGLEYGTRACCGYGAGPYNFDPQLYCGNSKVVGGKKVTAKACHDPQHYVSWDGIHSTEAANKIITQAILSGSYFHPRFELSRICDLQPIV